MAHGDNEDRWHRLFRDHEIEDVIHFAGLKAVGESVESHAMAAAGVF